MTIEKHTYLKQILDSLQSHSTLEQKYTASDILTVLETIFDELKLDEIKEYEPKDNSFDCQHCKHKINSDENSNLTKQDFNYCPNCGKRIEK